jgi:hypothetical protein
MQAQGRVAQDNRRPDIAGASWLLRAYRELETHRAVGMGLGPIPVMAAVAYADRFGLPQWLPDAVRAIAAAEMEVQDGN